MHGHLYQHSMQRGHALSRPCMRLKPPAAKAVSSNALAWMNDAPSACSDCSTLTQRSLGRAPHGCLCVSQVSVGGRHPDCSTHLRMRWPQLRAAHRTSKHRR